MDKIDRYATVLYSIHIMMCIFLILVVLLQQGKGADLSVFGGGGTMTAFGARGAASMLHKLTVGGFVLFIITTLTIGVFQKQGGGSSVMSGAPTAAETQPATAEEEGAEREVTGALPEAEESAPRPPDAGSEESSEESSDTP